MTSEVVNHIGADNVTWASDYPHIDASFGVVKEMRESIGSLPSDAQRKVLGENVVRFLRSGLMHRRLYMSVLALALTVGCAQSNPVAERAAQDATQPWLSLMDAGEYEQCWDAAAPLFRDTESLDAWVAKAEGYRNPTRRLPVPGAQRDACDSQSVGSAIRALRRGRVRLSLAERYDFRDRVHATARGWPLVGGRLHRHAATMTYRRGQ